MFQAIWPRGKSSLEKYKIYRNASKHLIHRVMDKSLSPEALQSAGRLLGILQGKVFVFDSENESDALADFALQDCRVNGKTAIQRYKEEVGGKDPIEQEILDAWLASYTSLFKIVSVSRFDRTLQLRDLLGGREVSLTDIGFSQTARVGLLLFIRIVPFGDFSMTSGVAFLFPGDLESYLLRKYKKLANKMPSESEPVKRFASFFRLNRTDGTEVKFEG